MLRDRRLRAVRRAAGSAHEASACSISTLICSIRPLSSRSASRPPFSSSHRAVSSACCSMSTLASSVSASSRARACRSLSASCLSEICSICTCISRRATTSSSCGREVASMRSLAAASSTRSMALSGRNRSVMYLQQQQHARDAQRGLSGGLRAEGCTRGSERFVCACVALGRVPVGEHRRGDERAVRDRDAVVKLVPACTHPPPPPTSSEGRPAARSKGRSRDGAGRARRPSAEVSHHLSLRPRRMAVVASALGWST